MIEAKNILVSIVIPVFNREKFIRETIESVLKQDYSNWELLLVDDGSTDGSVEICKEYVSSDERIKFLLRTSTPKGASTCRNIGLSNSKGEWVIFLDSDDLLSPICLSQRMGKLMEENRSLDFAAFPMLLFRKEINDLMILQNINSEIHPLDRFIQKENVWLMSSVIWSKIFLNKLDGYQETALSFQDWEINVRALIHSDNWKFYDKLIPDNFYRQHGETISKFRFSKEHVINNIETFINCFRELKRSNKFSEERRGYFGSLFFDWMKRFSGISMRKEERNSLRNEISRQLLTEEVFTTKERRRVLRFLKLSDNPFLLRIRFLGKVWELWNRLFLPKNYFVTLKKTQGIIKYNGKLN